MTESVEVEVVESRGPEGFGFFVKVQTSGRFYRISPARDPHQPRFWCLLVTRCSSAGVADPTERPWLGAGGMTREELPTALAAIRADVGGWLAQDACGELRAWLLSGPAVAPEGGVVGASSRSRAVADPALGAANTGEAHAAG